jgi:transposase
MSLHPQEIPPIPEETARVARAILPQGNRYVLLRDELGTIYSDELFADVYPRLGQPAEQPWRLALVTVMQFMENYTDRRAAEAVRLRIDWKYVLSLALTDPGFDFSVLSEFRTRLLEGEQGERLLSTLLLRISLFLPRYLEKKRRIPSDSRWYKLVPQQKAWYLSEESYVTSATAAQTSLRPDMKPDQRWVEKELLSLQSRCLDACIKDGRMDVVFRILNNENEIFEALGEEWDIELGGQLLTDVTAITDSFLTQLDQTTADRLGAHSPLAEKVGIADFLGLLPITLLLGFAKRLEKIDIERLGDTLGRVKWRRAKAIYELALPPPILERLETIQRGIASLAGVALG